MIGREAIELLLLAAIGALPASLLSRQLDLAARIALAPVLGFAIGIDLFTSTLNHWPGNTTSWLVPFVGACSLLGAVLVALYRRYGTSRASSGGPRSALLGILQVLLVCAAISTPFLWSFHQAGSDGPAAYIVSDAIAYTTETDGAQYQSLPTAAAESNQQPDQLISYWASYVQADQRVDAAPLLANIDSFLGLHATQTQSSFLLSILVVGGLGVFAAVRYLLRSYKWISTIAGALFGGSMFLQLFFDGSQAAICALAVISTILVLGIVVIREKRIADCVAFAFVCAALISVYPYYTPELAVGAAVVIGVLALRRVLPAYRNGAVRNLTVGAGCLVLIALLTVFTNTVGYGRMRHALDTYTSSISGQPNYTFLVPRVLPSWLTQSQGLYSLQLSTHPVWENVLFALIAPLALAVFVVAGVWRTRALLAGIPLAGMFVFAAVYARLHTYTGFPTGCTYCMDRNLLPVVPLLAIAGFVGLGVLLAKGRLLTRGAALVGGIALLGSIAYGAYQSQQLFENGAFFLPNTVLKVLSNVPVHSRGAIEIEGFDEAAPNAVASNAFTYLAIDERYRGRASWAAGNDENGDQLYYYNPNPSLADRRYQPLYQYVLTRFPAVKAGRTLLDRIGSVGLYERSNPLDVTVDYGLSVTYPPSDGSGTPLPNIWNYEPIQFVVSGGSQKQNAYVRLSFVRAAPNPTVGGVDGSSTSVRLTKDQVNVCVTTAGVAPTRTATFTLSPITGSDLLSMSASNRPCRAA